MKIRVIVSLICFAIVEYIVLVISSITSYTIKYDTRISKNMFETGLKQLNTNGTETIKLIIEQKNPFFIIATCALIIYIIYVNIKNRPIGYTTESTYAVHGSSRFANIKEITSDNQMKKYNEKLVKDELIESISGSQDYNKKCSGIIVGKDKKDIIIQSQSSSIANRNQFVVGGPGSFKTQSYIVTNILNEKECSIVTTDPKGEVYELTAEVKRKQGYEVHVINFANMSMSDRYNPFDYLGRDRDATTVANTIVAAKNNSKNKDIWYNAQLALLKALILYSIYELPEDERNMKGVLKILQTHDCMEDELGISELDELFMELKMSHPARMAYELGFKMSQEKTRSSIVISLLTTIADYTDEEVSNFTSCSDFMLGDLGKRKIALYVIIPVMDTTWEGLINLLFNQAFQELYNVGSENNAKLPQPVNFYLDEFPNLGKFDDYETFLATCRGYGISCCTVMQSITQLQDKYGKERAESILGNCAVKICMGNVNDTTAKYFSELMGKSTVKVETSSTSVSTGNNGSSSNSDSYNYVGRNLMNADEILTMKSDESIVIISGKYPIKLKKVKQYELFKDITSENRVKQTDYKVIEQ